MEGFKSEHEISEAEIKGMLQNLSDRVDSIFDININAYDGSTKHLGSIELDNRVHLQLFRHNNSQSIKYTLISTSYDPEENRQLISQYVWDKEEGHLDTSSRILGQEDWDQADDRKFKIEDLGYISQCLEAFQLHKESVS